MGTLSLIRMSSIGQATGSAGGHLGRAGGMSAGQNSGNGHERDGDTGGCSGKSDSRGAGGASGNSFGGIRGNVNVEGLDKLKGATDASGELGVGEIRSTKSSDDEHAVGAGGGTGAEGKGIDAMSGAIGSYVASGSQGVNERNDSVGNVIGNETAGSGQNQKGSWMNGGAGGSSGAFVGAPSRAGGAETVGGRMDGTKGSECVSSGNSDAYGNQAVEVTERRTVLIR